MPLWLIHTIIGPVQGSASGMASRLPVYYNIGNLENVGPTAEQATAVCGNRVAIVLIAELLPLSVTITIGELRSIAN